MPEKFLENLQGTILWPILLVAARKLVVPLLGAVVGILLDAGLLDGQLGEALLRLLNS